MSMYIEKMFKLSSTLIILLGATVLNSAKASALDVSQIPVIGSSLQRLQPTIEPNFRVLDRGLSGNTVQICLLTCSPAELNPTRLGLPINSITQPQTQSAPVSTQQIPQSAPVATQQSLPQPIPVTTQQSLPQMSQQLTQPR